MMDTPPKILATDLDGTLIPLAGNTDNERDLHRLVQELAAAEMQLMFVTGRHFASVQRAMVQYQLPTADWIICDVGTTLYRRQAEGDYQPSKRFAKHLQQIIGDFPVEDVARLLSRIAALRMQESEKQGRFKLSYYCDSDQLAHCVELIEQVVHEHQLPYSVISSVDPFEFVGLIDLLPRNASKAYALEWWSSSLGLNLHDVVFAGDSGNDSAALGAGYRAIVVGNAAPEVLIAAQQAHAAAGLRNRIYAAQAPATSGVLAGLRHYMDIRSNE